VADELHRRLRTSVGWRDMCVRRSADKQGCRFVIGGWEQVRLELQCWALTQIAGESELGVCHVEDEHNAAHANQLPHVVASVRLILFGPAAPNQQGTQEP